MRKQILFTIDRNVTRVETTLLSRCSPLLKHCTALLHLPPPVAFFQMPFRTPVAASATMCITSPAISWPSITPGTYLHRSQSRVQSALVFYETSVRRPADPQERVNAFAEPKCTNDARSQTMYSASLSREHRNQERGQR